jgi:hypothetical protein
MNEETSEPMNMPARPTMSLRSAELQYKVAHTNARLAGQAMSIANETAARARDLWQRTQYLLTDAEHDLHRALAAEADGLAPSPSTRKRK